jgi:hypothetical protein
MACRPAPVRVLNEDTNWERLNAIELLFKLGGSDDFGGLVAGSRTGANMGPHVCCGLPITLSPDGRKLFVAGASTLYVSTNFGTTWITHNLGIIDPATSANGTIVSALCFSPCADIHCLKRHLKG